MSHVEFKKCQCRMSLSISVPCRMSLSLMSPVDFKKGLCRRVELGVEGHATGHKQLVSFLYGPCWLNQGALRADCWQIKAVSIQCGHFQYLCYCILLWIVVL